MDFVFNVRIDYTTLTIDSILHTIYDLTDPFEEIISVSLCKVPKGFDESKEELSRVTREIHAKCGALFNNRSAVAAKEERAQQGANAGFYRFKLLGP